MKHDDIGESIAGMGLSDEGVQDHDTEAEIHMHLEVRRLRTDANRFLRQRNELLQNMRCILAACQNWNGGWVGKGQDAKDVIQYITETAAHAIVGIGSNGQ
jgi:hypothetical protein